MRRVISFLKTILIDRLNDFHLFLVLSKMTMPDSQLYLIIQTFSDVYNLDNLVFSIVVSLQKWLAHFYSRKTLSNLEWSDKGFKVTVVNRALQSLHGGSHESMLIVLIVCILLYSKFKFLKMEKKHLLILKIHNGTFCFWKMRILDICSFAN